MANFGLYLALRGKNNWAQRRQDAQQNLQIQEALTKQQLDREAEGVKAEEKLSAAYADLSKMDYLEKDKDRIYAKEKELRGNVVKQIAAYNGDLRKFMSGGGVTELKNYQDALTRSDEVNLAQQNKVELARYIEDSKKGDKYFFKTKIKVPVLDSNKNPVTDDKGQPTYKLQDVSMDEQIKLHQDGLINKINYGGSEKLADINMMTFKPYMKDESNPLGDNRVTKSDIYHYLVQGGTSKQQAMEQAEKYVSAVGKGANPWYWKGVDEDIYNLNKANMIAELQSKRAASSGDSSTYKLGVEADQIRDIKLNQVERLDPTTTQNVSVGILKFGVIPATKESPNVKYIPPKGMEAVVFDSQGNPITTRIGSQNVTNAVPTGEITKRMVGGQPRVFMKYQIDLNSDIADDTDGTVISEKWWTFNTDDIDDRLQGSGKNQVEDLGGGNYRYDSYVDITNVSNNESLLQWLVHKGVYTNKNKQAVETNTRGQVVQNRYQQGVDAGYIDPNVQTQ